MAYEKQTWQTGDTVTAAKLNHMEDGIAGGGTGGVELFVVPVTGAEDPDSGDWSYSTDISMTDVLTAASAGKVVIYAVNMTTSNNIEYDISTSVICQENYILAQFMGGFSLYHTADGIGVDEPDSEGGGNTPNPH